MSLLKARDRDVCQPPIHELFFCLFSVHVDENAVGSLSLAAVARHGIPVIEMRILLDVEGQTTPRIESKLQISVRVRFLDSPPACGSQRFAPYRAL